MVPSQIREAGAGEGEPARALGGERLMEVPRVKGLGALLLQMQPCGCGSGQASALQDREGLLVLKSSIVMAKKPKTKN